MICTEEEAKTKTCHVTLHRCASNGARGQDDNCIGSACMAWKWALVHDGSFNVTAEGPTLEIVRRVPNFVESDKGFCGLTHPQGA